MLILMSNTKNGEKNISIPLEALIAVSAFPVVVACAVWLVCYFRRNSAPWKNPSKLTGLIFCTLFLFQALEFFNQTQLQGSKTFQVVVMNDIDYFHEYTVDVCKNC